MNPNGRQPYDFGEARDAAARSSAAQKLAEDWLINAAKDAALKEEAYRVALATRIVELHAEGVAWTVAGDVARGDKTVASLRRERDIAEGVREAAVQAAWRAAADRKDAGRFCDWSMRAAFVDAQPPEQMPTFGGRRAA